jgi:Hemerythrin HHE cation binding domain/Phasin protein
MTTIRQFILTSPAKAMELFAKLLDTSENAIKTRERLFGELKAELELVLSLEEQHLFPVLRKHKQTKDLVQEALSDNSQTRKLLARLESTPKSDEDFLSQVAELKKLFQQHVRDEKKELLPAVLKALSDEEAEAILAKIEDEKAEVEAAKQAEAEERRAEARQEREQLDRVERTAEEMASTVTAVAGGAWSAARAAQDTVRTGLGTASEIAQRSTDRVVQLFSLSGKQTQDAAVQAADGVQAVAQSSTALIRGLQQISFEWFTMTQNRVQMNMEALAAFSQTRSVPDFLAAQIALVRGNVELALENSQRLAQLSAGVIEQATRSVSAERETTPDRGSRAA